MGFSRCARPWKPRRVICSARWTPAPKRLLVSGFGSLEGAWLKRPGVWEGFWMGKCQGSHWILGHHMEIKWDLTMGFFLYVNYIPIFWMVILMGFWWLTLKSWGKSHQLRGERPLCCLRKHWELSHLGVPCGRGDTTTGMNYNTWFVIWYDLYSRTPFGTQGFLGILNI